MKATIVSLLLFTTPALAKTVTGAATFTAEASPNFLTIEGEGGKVVGSVDDGGKGTLTVALKDLKTGMGLRDEHMNEYLETGKYPKAKLVVTAVTADGFAGDFTLHGVTKAIKGSLKKEGSHAHAEFVVKLSDYKLGSLSKMGVTVANDVKVVVEVDAK